MNREEIIRMAREADSYADKHGPSAWRHPDEFAAFRDEHFAALVAAAEREACAKVCTTLEDSPRLGLIAVDVDENTTKVCAAAIRARGQA